MYLYMFYKYICCIGTWFAQEEQGCIIEMAVHVACDYQCHLANEAWIPMVTCVLEVYIIYIYLLK